MSTDTPAEQRGGHGYPEPECPEPGYPTPTDPVCRPEEIDGLRCEAKGIEVQAADIATYRDLLAQARKDYDTTRKDYRAKRHDAVCKVQDMRHQIRHLTERIRCMIEQDRVVRCLDEAFETILEELTECGPVGGCCVEECEFDTYVPDDYTELVERIETYKRHVADAKECFTRLIGEPAALEKRVTEAKKEIDAINAAIGGDPATTDLKRLYASALVAGWHIDRIWWGFDEIKDFVECLCRALTCWAKGATAISVLKGAQAVRDCQNEAAQQRCKDLRENTVEEILAGFDRLCPPPDHEDPSDYDDDDPAPPDIPYQENPDPDYGRNEGPRSEPGYGREPRPGRDTGTGRPRDRGWPRRRS